MTNVNYHVQNIFLTFHRSYRINFVECILLQNNKVDQFRFPENNVIFYRYTIVTKNIDLLGNLFTTLQTCFQFIDLTNPFTVDVLFDVCFKFRIFDIFRIRIDRIHSRITFLIGTVLFQSIETTCYFLRIFSHRLFQVTTGRRYRTDESNRTCFVIVQFHISRTTVEVGDDSRNIHRESIRTRQLLHTVGHLTQSLRPTGS